jgi:hypothetical protein
VNKLPLQSRVTVGNVYCGAENIGAEKLARESDFATLQLAILLLHTGE